MTHTTRTFPLSEHFTLYEATHSDKAEAHGIINVMTPDDVIAIFDTARRMEEVRAVLGNLPITVSSWFRCPEVNRLVGGSDTSDHMSGRSVDFACPQHGSITQVCRSIAASDLQFDQLIWEHGRWCHLGFGTGMRRQLLRTNPSGSGWQWGIP